MGECPIGKTGGDLPGLRMQQGRPNKARRGELTFPVPAGYVRQPTGPSCTSSHRSEPSGLVPRSFFQLLLKRLRSTPAVTNGPLCGYTRLIPMDHACTSPVATAPVATAGDPDCGCAPQDANLVTMNLIHHAMGTSWGAIRMSACSGTAPDGSTHRDTLLRQGRFSPWNHAFTLVYT